MNHTTQGQLPTYVLEWIDERMSNQLGRVTPEAAKGYLVFSGIVDTYNNRAGDLTGLTTSDRVQEWLDNPINVYRLMVHLVNN